MEEMYGRKSMQWLLGIPVFFLLLGPNIKGILISLAVYLAICSYISVKKIKILSPFRQNILSYIKPCSDTVIIFLLVFALAIRFYRNWIPSGKVSAIAGLFHLKVSTFLGIVCIPLSVISFISIRSIWAQLSPGISEKYKLHVSDHCSALGIYRHLFLLICAILVITICSKSSPLYPLNDWDDSNCFLTVGKSMLVGKVPYRDLMEQKGPILYAIHAVTALVSFDSFIGVWLIEIFCCYLFLVFSYKTCLLFDAQASITLMPFAAALTYASASFAHGDCAEELCLPLLAYAFYIGLKAIGKKELPSAKESFVIGLTSACVLWIKYTMLGFYLGWALALLIFTIQNKEYKLFLKMLGLILSGVVVVTIPVALYFGLNHALPDLWKVYFYNNLFSYSNISSGNLLSKVETNIRYGYSSLKKSHLCSLISFAVLSISIFLFFHDKKHLRGSILSYVFIPFLFLFLSVYGGGRNSIYYALIFSIWIPLGILFFWNAIKNVFHIPVSLLGKHRKMMLAASLCIGCLLSLLSSNVYLMFKPRSEMPQFIFKKDIESYGESNPTLLNYGFLDGGFYTVMGIVPNTRYFCLLNIAPDEHIEYQNDYIAQEMIDYIVTRGESPMEFPQYTVIDCATNCNKGTKRTYWLYRHNDGNEAFSNESANLSE